MSRHCQTLNVSNMISTVMKRARQNDYYRKFNKINKGDILWRIPNTVSCPTAKTLIEGIPLDESCITGDALAN